MCTIKNSGGSFVDIVPWESLQVRSNSVLEIQVRLPFCGTSGKGTAKSERRPARWPCDPCGHCVLRAMLERSGRGVFQRGEGRFSNLENLELPSVAHVLLASR